MAAVSACRRQPRHATASHAISVFCFCAALLYCWHCAFQCAAGYAASDAALARYGHNKYAAPLRKPAPAPAQRSFTPVTLKVASCQLPRHASAITHLRSRITPLLNRNTSAFQHYIMYTVFIVILLIEIMSIVWNTRRRHDVSRLLHRGGRVICISADAYCFLSGCYFRHIRRHETMSTPMSYAHCLRAFFFDYCRLQAWRYTP